MAEVAIPRQMFQEILQLIAELRRSHHQRQREMQSPFGKPAMPVAIDTTFSGLPAIQKIATIQLVWESSRESPMVRGGCWSLQFFCSIDFGDVPGFVELGG
jgi:hypothetical protein